MTGALPSESAYFSLQQKCTLVFPTINLVGKCFCYTVEMNPESLQSLTLFYLVEASAPKINRKLDTAQALEVQGK